MAIERRIIKRRRVHDAAIASQADFEVGSAEEITLRAIYAKACTARTVSPYAIDFVRRELAFVRTNEDVDLAKAHTYFHEAQRRYATHLIVASFEEAFDAARVLGTSRMRYAFLYSAGHSGATVTGRIADALPGVQSIAEPDLFSSIACARLSAGQVEEDARVRALAAGAALFAAHREAVDPAHPMLFVKLRGRATFGASEIGRALPAARAVYLHRHPADVVDSYIGAFFANPLARLGRALLLDRLFVLLLRRLLPRTHPWVPLALPVLFEQRAEGERAQGAVEVLALVLHAMRLEFDRLRSSGDARLVSVIRFEDLKSDGARFVRRLARGVGVRVDHVDIVNALRATHDEVEIGTPIVTRKRPSLSPGDVASVERTLAKVESYLDPMPA